MSANMKKNSFYKKALFFKQIVTFGMILQQIICISFDLPRYD